MDPVDQIIALLHNQPGPFLETEDSFFGHKNTNPSMKNANMQTDLGGMLITKAKITYGEADELASKIDLIALHKFIDNDKYHFAYFKCTVDNMFIGQIYYLIFQFLKTEKILDINQDYHNGYEYLYTVILKRLVDEKLVENKDNDWRYFKKL